MASNLAVDASTTIRKASLGCAISWELTSTAHTRTHTTDTRLDIFSRKK